MAGKTLSEKLHNAYMDLQLRLNLLYDQAHNRLEKHPLPGLRQILEKKAVHSFLIVKNPFVTFMHFWVF